MPPNVFENVLITTGTRPSMPVSSTRPVPRVPERAGAVRVVAQQHRAVFLAHLDELSQRRAISVERVDAFHQDQRVVALLGLETALERLHRVVVEVANLRRLRGRTGGEKRAVEDASV